jgi:hypothetical protein
LASASSRPARQPRSPIGEVMRRVAMDMPS